MDSPYATSRHQSYAADSSPRQMPVRPHRKRDDEGEIYRGGHDNGGYTNHPVRSRSHSRSRSRSRSLSPSPRPRHHSSSQHRSYNQSAHYAESAIRMPPAGSQRTLVPVAGAGYNHHGSRRGSSGAVANRPPRPASTLPGRSGVRTPGPPGSSREVSKIVRSKSLSSRPAGLMPLNAHNPPLSVGPTSTIGASRPGTRMSSKSGRSTNHPGNSTKAGVVVETMSAPNPFCPNTRGVCCLLVLVNLALILIAIGFIIVLQLHDPTFVWNIGVVILVFGFFTILVAMLYCMCICQESDHPRNGRPANGELYWTHHWQKNIAIPELKSSGDKERWVEQDRFPEDDLRHDDLSDTSSRDYPRLYLESDYGQRTDREADFETDREMNASHSNSQNKRRS